MASPVPATALLSVTKARQEHLPTGLPPIDETLKGFPRGAITELTGPRSSGRTSLLFSTLAGATARQECCAVIDTRNAFDPASADRCGVDLRRLVWVRCQAKADAALKAADLILHGGGFGVVCLDLSEVPQRVLNRIPISYWYRFRRAVEKTPTVFLILAERPNAKSCASCWIEFRKVRIRWSGREPSRLLRGLEARLLLRKPARNVVLPFEAKAL